MFTPTTLPAEDDSYRCTYNLLKMMRCPWYKTTIRHELVLVLESLCLNYSVRYLGSIPWKYRIAFVPYIWGVIHIELTPQYAMALIPRRMTYLWQDGSLRVVWPLPSVDSAVHSKTIHTIYYMAFSGIIHTLQTLRAHCEIQYYFKACQAQEDAPGPLTRMHSTCFCWLNLDSQLNRWNNQISIRFYFIWKLWCCTKMKPTLKTWPSMR